MLRGKITHQRANFPTCSSSARLMLFDRLLVGSGNTGPRSGSSGLGLKGKIRWLGTLLLALVTALSCSSHSKWRTFHKPEWVIAIHRGLLAAKRSCAWCKHKACSRSCVSNIHKTYYYFDTRNHRDKHHFPYKVQFCQSENDRIIYCISDQSDLLASSHDSGRYSYHYS